MKKSLLILICLSAFAFNLVNAQCTPNLTGPNGQISPDSAQNLPHARVGQAYATDIQLWVPHDTVVNNIPIPINYYKIDSVHGLPTTFSYACNPNTCQFPHDAAGCIHISGPAPTNGMIGTYPLTVYIDANVTIVGPTDQYGTVNYYKIVIDSASSGIPNLNLTRFDVTQNFPNPLFAGSTEIDYSTPLSSKMTFNVFNMLGQAVITRILNAKQGINQIYINSNELAPGIYMYSLNNGTQTITKRMVVGSR
jgi:hypothetical protein